MFKIFISNAFSLQMVDIKAHNMIETFKLSIDDVKGLCRNHEVISCIGHADLANVVSSILETEIKPNRISINLNVSDMLVVAQLTGGRLPEGTTKLPEGFNIEFVCVRLVTSIK